MIHQNLILGKLGIDKLKNVTTKRKVDKSDIDKLVPVSVHLIKRL